jgi:hypothetical protein
MYVLSQVPDAVLKAALADGRINRRCRGRMPSR